MKVLELIDQLEDIVENATSVPFAMGKALVGRKEMLEILKDIRVVMPDELKQAKWIKDERTKILNDAQQEADRIGRSAVSEANVIVAEAHDRVEKLVQKDEIVRRATQKGDELLSLAKKEAHEIRQGAYRYADEVMMKLELSLEKHHDAVKRNRLELQKYQDRVQE